MFTKPIVGFNLLVLWLRGENSIFFPLVVPPLELKSMISVYLVTVAREKDEYDSHNWDVQGVLVAVETGRKLEQPGVCCMLFRGSCPQTNGPSAVAD